MIVTVPNIVPNPNEPVTEDPKMTENQVIEALQTERAYQLRRWGIRQPDGSMAEASHSCFDFLAYCTDYSRQAVTQFSREASSMGALNTFRKVVGLAVAALEHAGMEPFAHLDELNINIPPHPGVGFFLMGAQSMLADATDTIGQDNSLDQCENVHNAMKDIINLGVQCFRRYGVERRNSIKIVFNARDGEQA